MSIFGGPEGIRTLDLSDANRTRSQLRYRPISYLVCPHIIPAICGFVKWIFHIGRALFAGKDDRIDRKNGSEKIGVAKLGII